MTTQARWAAGLLALLILLSGIGSLVAREPTGTYEISAYFHRTIGVYPRSPVKVLGVDVGRVLAVVPEGDRVRVDMRVDADVRIPADARAIVVPISLIADRYIQLEPAWTEGPVLGGGETIPLERGVAPAELDDLLVILEDFLAAIETGTPEEPGVLGELFVNLDASLAGRGEELGTTVDSLATILDVLARNADSFDRMLFDLDRVIGARGAQSEAIAATNRGLNSVLGAVAQEEAALDSGLSNIASLMEELDHLARPAILRHPVDEAEGGGDHEHREKADNGIIRFGFHRL
jgi:phospholipid/cholesterol/gamma-HCH transport system substrate-binding protein